MNWTNLYENSDGKWYKGNLHTHSNLSKCGRIPLEEIRSIYKKQKMDFFAMTDHNRISAAASERVPKELAGIEIDFQGTHHMLAVNTDEKLLCSDNTKSQQQLINENAALGAVTVLNHPDWQGEHYTFDCLNSFTGYTGIEIYNSVIERLNGSPLSTKKWDMLLTAGHKIFGFANQDAHLPEDFSYCGNVVRAQNDSPAQLLQAIHDGNFYCFYGVQIAEIKRNVNTIHVHTRNADLIRFIGWDGAVLKKVKGKKASIDFTDDARYRYIRVECLGHGEEISWSQPFFREA